jgi:hypothetical protein
MCFNNLKTLLQLHKLYTECQGDYSLIFMVYLITLSVVLHMVELCKNNTFKKHAEGRGRSLIKGAIPAFALKD